jgi:hypothetical protein
MASASGAGAERKEGKIAEVEEDEEQEDVVSFKVIVLGDGAVGKTSLCTRFCDDSFDKQYKQTIGERGHGGREGAGGGVGLPAGGREEEWRAWVWAHSRRAQGWTFSAARCSCPTTRARLCRCGTLAGSPSAAR